MSTATTDTPPGVDATPGTSGYVDPVARPVGGYATDAEVRRDAGHPADPNYVERDEYGRKTPAQIEREINRTRGRMDTTIERLKNRLQPANLVDEALHSFGISPQQLEGNASESLKSAGRGLARAAKDNPVPTALVAAAALWKLFADDEQDPVRHDRPVAVASPMGPAGYRTTYDPSTGRMTYAPRVPAWHGDHVWDDDVHRDTWTEAAGRKVDQLTATLSDATQSSKEKLRSLSETLSSLSGSTHDELHDQWDSLREVNGSFVDARTGEPYSDDYGREYRALLAAEQIRSGGFEMAEDDESWTEMVEATLDSVGKSLADTSRSASQRLSDAARSFGDLMSGCWTSTCDYTAEAADYTASAGREGGRRLRDAAAAAGYYAGRGATAVGQGASATGSAIAGGATSAGQAVAAGSRTAGEYVAHAARVTGETVSDAASSVAGAAISAGHSIASGLSAAGEGIASGASATGEFVTDTSRRVSRRTAVATKQAWHKTGDTFDDYPLAMGAAALGVGLLGGLLIPRTRFEDRRFGDRSDELKQQATAVAEQAVEAGKDVAHRTVDAAAAEARRQGIAPDQIRSQAEGLAEQAKATAGDLAAEVQQRASQLAGDVQAKAESVAGDAASKAATAAETVAGEVRGAADAAKHAADETSAKTGAGELRMKVEEVVATAAETAENAIKEKAKDVTG